MQATTHTLAPKKNSPAKAASKKAPSKPAATTATPAAPEKPVGHKRTTSEDVAAMYQKVSPIEHVLLRPEMYIGSIENHKIEHMWMFKPDATRKLFPRLLPAGPQYNAAAHAVNGTMIERAGGSSEDGGDGEGTSKPNSRKEDIDDDAAEEDETLVAKKSNAIAEESIPPEVVQDTTGEFDEVDGAVKGVDVRLLDPKHRVERIWGPGSLYQTSVCENPGLMKIVDEILVNAADNRLQSKKTPQTYIRVTVDDKTGRVTISNDGRGIPVVMHTEHNAFIPDLIFGHLLTSSHYSNDPDSTAAGRHGYGAKLTNIMSTRFEVECVCEGKRFIGKWRNNMHEKDITIEEHYDPAKSKKSGIDIDEETLELQKVSNEDMPPSRTVISFIPDFDRFMTNDKKLLEDQALFKKEFDALVDETVGLTDVPEEKKERLRYLSTALADIKLPLGFNIKAVMRDLVKKRCLDLAASIVGSGVNVYFNNELISPNSLAAYSRMHFPESNIDTQPFVLENKKDGFTICVSFTRPPVAAGALGSATGANPNSPTNRVNIALVNSLVTPQGGTHLNHAQRAVDAAISHVSATIRKTMGLSLSDSLIRNNCQLVVSCNVKQPKFDSQSKQKLVSKHPYPHLPTKALEAYMMSIPFLSEFCSINNAADLRKINMELKRLQDQKHIIDKLVEPPKNSAIKYRTLILTEGDSAKALALNALTTEQRESFGVYPLRGKVLNVRTNPIAKLMKNKELLNVVAALGLQLKGEYTSLEQLRYQRVIIMTDQDHDGTHIRGLLINFFHYLWPQLMRDHPNFITIFSTPLVKVKIPAKLLDNDKEKHINFYNEKKFDNWRSQIPEWKMQKIFVRYYKGLGTSTSKEGREYFEQIEDRLSAIEFNEDQAVDDACLEEMFGGIASARRSRMDASRAEALKSGEQYTIAEQKKVTVPDFASKELVQFANYDNKRSIPNFVDGLKVSQRKVLWSMMTRNSPAMRVSQIAGYVSEMSHYHHGESSLIGSIIVMARDYVSSNNIPLLSPEGQFGSRSQEGRDHAAARYIFSKIAKVTRFIFPKEDDEHLQYINNDGDRVEPEFYAPVIPFALVNGTRSIGFGYMNTIQPRDPLKILEATRQVVEGKPLNDAFNVDVLTPSYSGFRGATKRDALTGDTYTYGVVELHATKASLESFSELDLAGVSTRFLPSMVNGSVETVERGPEIMRDIIVLRITELPIGEVPSNYRTMVDSKFGDMVINYADYSGADHVDIEITVRAQALFHRIKGLREETFLAALGLRRRVGGDVLAGFDSKGNLYRSAQITQFLVDYFDVRLKTYERRLDALRKKCKFDIDRTNSIIAFSKMVREDKGLFKLSEEALIKKLSSAKLLKIDDSYAYLTNRSVTSMLDVNFQTMTKRLEALKAEQINLRDNVTPQTLWIKDLSELEKQIIEVQRARVESIEKAIAPRNAAVKKTLYNTILRGKPHFSQFASKHKEHFPELSNGTSTPLKAHSIIMYTMKERGWTPAIQWRGVLRQMGIVERLRHRQRVLSRRSRNRRMKEESRAQRLARIAANQSDRENRKKVMDQIREEIAKKKASATGAAAAAAAAAAAPQKGKVRGSRSAKIVLDSVAEVPRLVQVNTTPLFAVTMPIADRMRLFQAANVATMQGARQRLTSFTATGMMSFARRFIF